MGFGLPRKPHADGLRRRRRGQQGIGDTHELEARRRACAQLAASTASSSELHVTHWDEKLEKEADFQATKAIRQYCKHLSEGFIAAEDVPENQRAAVIEAMEMEHTAA